jgi:5'(3')-deoxyribonucleotidase
MTGADVLIDDKPGTVNEFDAAGRLGILFSRPHNADYPQVRDGVVRVHGWPAVLDVIQLEAEEVL